MGTIAKRILRKHEIKDLRMAMRFHFVFVLVITAACCAAQVQTYYIRPVQTDPGYDPTEDSSAVSRNTTSQVNKLFLFIGGTGSSSSTSYNALRLLSAGLGFDFINLSYPNSVAAASLASDPDSMAFDHYRQELCFGTPVSDDVNVDSLNSIHTRTVRLLNYLDLTYPLQNWGQYLASPSTLDWSRIVVGGHSQGSGHACYLAKQYAVDRVLMFSGPNDYSDFHSNSAHWVRQPGATSVSGHYSYLSLNDEAVAYDKQSDVIIGLGMLAGDDTTHVDPIPAPYGNSHCLYTTQPPGVVLLNHNVPIMLSAINNDVWTYLLTSSTTTGIIEPGAGSGLSAFPNPASSVVYVNSSMSLGGEAYVLRCITGATAVQGRIPATDPAAVELSGLQPGIYFLSIGDRTVKVVVQ